MFAEILYASAHTADKTGPKVVNSCSVLSQYRCPTAKSQQAAAAEEPEAAEKPCQVSTEVWRCMLQLKSALDLGEKSRSVMLVAMLPPGKPLGSIHLNNSITVTTEKKMGDRWADGQTDTRLMLHALHYGCGLHHNVNK